MLKLKAIVATKAIANAFIIMIRLCISKPPAIQQAMTAGTSVWNSIGAKPFQETVCLGITEKVIMKTPNNAAVVKITPFTITLLRDFLCPPATFYFVL